MNIFVYNLHIFIVADVSITQHLRSTKSKDAIKLQCETLETGNAGVTWLKDGKQIKQEERLRFCSNVIHKGHLGNKVLFIK